MSNLKRPSMMTLEKATKLSRLLSAHDKIADDANTPPHVVPADKEFSLVQLKSIGQRLGS